MRSRLPTDTLSRVKVSGTALFLIIAVGSLYRVVSNGSIELVSLFVLEIALMLIYIFWMGVVRPLKA